MENSAINKEEQPKINIQPKLRIKEKISYGAGDFASNLIWGTLSSFLLYFYTDIALLPVVATGSIFLISRMLDAFIDPFVGGFIDHTHTKRGRTKPYMLFGIVPLCIFFVLSFTTLNMSEMAKVIYAYATYIIVGLLYSVVNIPYGALMSLMTKDSNEKTELSSFRMGGMAMGSILVSACTMPLVNFWGHGNQQQGFIFTTCLYSIIAIFCFWIITWNCQERNIEFVPIEAEHYTMFHIYKNALKNKPWLVTMAFSFMMFIKTGATVAITIYYCLQVLKSPAMISILLPLMYVSAIFSAIITPLFIKRFKYRKGNIIAVLFYAAGFAAMPFYVENQSLFITIYFIACTFGGINVCAVFGMTADSVDYNEWKFGKRSEGSLYAGYSFCTKVGMAVGGALVGYVLAFAGYDAQNITEAATSSINYLYFTIPIICSVLQVGILYFYRLDAIHLQIVNELNERR